MQSPSRVRSSHPCAHARLTRHFPSLGTPTPRPSRLPPGNFQALFPGRLEVILGDSRETAPAYRLREQTAGRDPAACNVVFIDGDHSEEGALTDLVAFEALANRRESRYPAPAAAPSKDDGVVGSQG